MRGNRWFHWSLIHASLLGVEVLRIDILTMTNWQRFDSLLADELIHLCVTEIVPRNLNKIINVNYYPIETAKRSNLRHRPIGIGVQGLADTLILQGMAFDSPEWDWKAQRESIVKNGVRNPLLVAPMPTASTSQMLGNNECFEPYTSNIYSRRVLRFEPYNIFPVFLQWGVCVGKYGRK
ncbi:hypothetical protein V6N13_076616 [Hibiscus sabdariffa]|uniref:Ribonucleotide reductase large subunit C-terminal domain-containing protein n=1 Tax=Hibiscus sabdariffa TaxID=183260 RepID=A0ABR2AV12_9ROSI